MKIRWITDFILVCCFFVLVACTQTHSVEKTTQVLIDGEKGLENFHVLGAASWHVKDGAIVADSGEKSFLVTNNSYKDFHLVIEFWADPTTNSGVFLRMSDPDEINASNAYEVNIYDQRPDPSFGTGAIVYAAKVDPMPKAGGRWNTYDITAQGSHLLIRLNGVETANVDDTSHSEGPIALQFGDVPDGKPGSIKWRKITIQSL